MRSRSSVSKAVSEACSEETEAEKLRLADEPFVIDPSAPKSRFNMLNLNSHLPVFPGGGGVEFLTMVNLARQVETIGLVSLAHTREDLEKTRALVEAGISLYLWESPHLDATPQGGSTPRRRLRSTGRRIVQAVVDRYRSWPSRPVDSLILDGNFRNTAPQLAQALSERNWHVVSVVESSAASAIDYFPRALVSILVMHDIRSLLFERRAEAASTERERRSLRREAARYRAFEREYCRRYDLVVTVSPHDAQWVRENYQPNRVITVPLPVDASYFEPASPADEKPLGILFTGLMNHPPNFDAAIYFAREVLPRIQEREPGATFDIVGRHPTAEVQALGNLPGVRVVGGVPDIRPHVASAGVIVVPLRYGSGSRQKILEAWAMEKCVVSTSVGAEGLAYVNGGNLLIADDRDAMVTSVLRVLRERALRDSLRQSGRSVVLTRHHPPRVASDYHREILQVLSEKAAVEEPMRIALDMRWMKPGLAGGLENLARAFVSELLSIDRHNRYTAILPAQCRFDFDVRRNANARTISTDSVRAALGRLRLRLSRSLFRRLRVDHWISPEVVNLRFLRSLDAEFVYSFPGYIYPDVFPLRQVLVVPDIQHEYLPEFFSGPALDERRRLYSDSIRRADHICAISEYTKKTLIEKLGTPADKITAVPLAADPVFRPSNDRADDAARLSRYGLVPGTYLYFPAHTWHHKNHHAAIEALRILRDRHGVTTLLVCTGGSREAQPALEQQVRNHRLEGQVRFLGYVRREDVPSFYRGAQALVFPSLFEGFGMPVLEAMASGCPVVCSNSTSLPEIAGDAARLVEPRNPEALAAEIAKVIRDADLRVELVSRGFDQAARFSWRRHTVETLGVFHRVHQRLKRVSLSS